jgi:hypothetical protein
MCFASLPDKESLVTLAIESIQIDFTPRILAARQTAKPGRAPVEITAVVGVLLFSIRKPWASVLRKAKGENPEKSGMR